MPEVLSAGGVRAEIDSARGARLVSLTFDGLEVLGGTADLGAVGPSIGTGCYPMVPWAGRIRGGLVEHDGHTTSLAVESEGNALHGLGRDAAWTSHGDGHFSAELADPWPEPGTATLDYGVRPDGIDVTLTWSPHDPTSTLGCALGLHPWFVRELDGVKAVLDVDPEQMVEREGRLPTGRLVEPADPPWDDCFRLVSPPRLSWPGLLDLHLTTDADWWVIFTSDAGAVCVEPQTVPPDSWEHPQLAPSRPSTLRFSITCGPSI